MKKVVFIYIMVLFISSSLYAMPLDEATFSVGKRFFSQSLYTEAEQRFLDIIRKFPDSEFYRQSLFYLGQIYAHLGKYKASLQYYKILLKKGQTIKEKQSALLGIAKSWMQLGVYNKAADFYSFFASEYPESEYAPAALYFSGIAREREDKISAAIEKHRLVLELYPQSDYYAKSIEKMAVLGSNTPEELWTDDAILSPKKTGKVEIFPEDNFDIYDIPSFGKSCEKVSEIIVIPDFTKTESEKNCISIPQETQIASTVISQKIDTSSFDNEVVQSAIDQSIALPQKPLPESVQRLKDCSVVQLINDQFIPVENRAEVTKKNEIEAYKKIWTKEYQETIKQGQLEDTADSIKKMIELAENKAQILNVKEQNLQEHHNKIRGNLYKDLKSMDEEKKMSSESSKKPRIKSPQINVESQPVTFVQEEIKTVFSSMPVSVNKSQCDDFDELSNDTYVLDKDIGYNHAEDMAESSYEAY